MPGVQSVAYANQFPLRGGWGGDIRIESASGPIDAEADLQAISPDYFATLGMTIVAGRNLDERDRTGAPAAVVVSRTFARRFLPGEDPIGRIVRRDGTAAPPADDLRVVGEVGVTQQLEAGRRRRCTFTAYRARTLFVGTLALASGRCESRRRCCRSSGAPSADLIRCRSVGGVRDVEDIDDAASVSRGDSMSSGSRVLAMLASRCRSSAFYRWCVVGVATPAGEIALRMGTGRPPAGD
jgi:hypothetical protein